MTLLTCLYPKRYFDSSSSGSFHFFKIVIRRFPYENAVDFIELKGAWLSWLEYYLDMVGVTGSSPVAPIISAPGSGPSIETTEKGREVE